MSEAPKDDDVRRMLERSYVGLAQDLEAMGIGPCRLVPLESLPPLVPDDNPPLPPPPGAREDA